MDYNDFEYEHDNDEIRCPKLGHSLNFSYCKNEGVTEPCSRIIKCWFPRIDILEYINSRYGYAYLEEFASKEAKDKLTTILEILEKHKKAAKNKDNLSQ